jgi:hypothetical protein
MTQELQRAGPFLNAPSWSSRRSSCRPTFDWRIGISPAPAVRVQVLHGQETLADHQARERRETARPFETLAVELDAPTKAVRLALKAANLIGDGLYGVDIKQSGKPILRDRGQRQSQHGQRRGGRGAEGRVVRRIMAVFLNASRRASWGSIA